MSDQLFNRLVRGSRHASALSVIAAIAVMLLVAGGMPSVGSAEPLAEWNIEVTSQETFWVDANKCSAEGPRGAWLSFWVTNTTGVIQNDVIVTFNGFTGGTSPSLFVPTSDPVRELGTMIVGQREAIYFYVDYSAVCTQSPLTGRTATYTLTVVGDSESTTLGPNTITTDTLITASAAGIVTSNILGPGVFLGQLLEQTVVYQFGNNKDVFFQPAAEATFNDSCLRLVDMRVDSVAANVTGIAVGVSDNRLWFPDSDIAATGGTGEIQVTFFWEVRCVSATQNASPWAAALSGNKYKYTAIGTPVTITDIQTSLTAAKSGPVCVESASPVATFKVTFTNTTGDIDGVPVFLKSIDDILPACMSILSAFATGSDVTAGNSSVYPAVAATGTVSWVSKYQSGSPAYNIKGWRIPNTGTDNPLELVFTADLSQCPMVSAWYTNQALGYYGNAVPTNIASWSLVYPCTPQAVMLADFGAVQQGDEVLVTWETVSELDNRGFNLYRATSAAGPFTQLNTALIPSQSQGSPSGFSYTWQDRAGLVEGMDYYYLLEDLDLSGATTSHGPVSVSYVGPTAVGLSAVQASPVAAGLPLAAILLALLAALTGGLAVRRARS